MMTQMLFFNAAVGYAFTIFLAGFALTITTLPKTSLLPATVAGFVRVFKRQRPGIAKTPVLLTSLDATSASVFKRVEQTFCFNSNSPAIVLAMRLLGMARADFFVVAFIGAFVFGNMTARYGWSCGTATCEN